MVVFVTALFIFRSKKNPVNSLPGALKVAKARSEVSEVEKIVAKSEISVKMKQQKINQIKAVMLNETIPNITEKTDEEIANLLTDLGF